MKRLLLLAVMIISFKVYAGDKQSTSSENFTRDPARASELINAVPQLKGILDGFPAHQQKTLLNTVSLGVWVMLAAANLSKPK